MKIDKSLVELVWFLGSIIPYLTKRVIPVLEIRANKKVNISHFHSFAFNSGVVPKTSGKITMGNLMRKLLNELV